MSQYAEQPQRDSNPCRHLERVVWVLPFGQPRPTDDGAWVSRGLPPSYSLKSLSEDSTLRRFSMILRAYIFHLRARNFSPATVKATGEYLRPFIALHDPLTATRRDIETYLGDMSERCKPSTVWTAWRHLKGFFKWLHAEGDISVDPMVGVTKPIVPPSEIAVLTSPQVRSLLATCCGKDADSRRDHALLAIMLDTGLRLSEIARLSIDDVGEDCYYTSQNSRWLQLRVYWSFRTDQTFVAKLTELVRTPALYGGVGQ
ncbi:MAG: hypothetical protein EXQ63_03795 [Ilumatobacteraceae bacterium]|nr:hypothetical protein [Ilumatobacteraceae bacterium]